jgi:hypothetical protein
VQDEVVDMLQLARDRQDAGQEIEFDRVTAPELLFPERRGCPACS